MQAAAHDLANGLNRDFRRVSVKQGELPGGGVNAELLQDSESSDGADLVGGMVDLMGAVYALKANLAVLRTSDRLLGTVLDIRA